MTSDRSLIISTDSLKGGPPIIIDAVPKAVARPVYHFIKTDTAQVVIRHINDKALKHFADDPTFDYTEEKSHATNWWDKFWEWFWHLFQNSTQNESTRYSIPYLSYIFWIAIGAFILFVIIKFATSNGINIFNRGSMQISDIQTGAVEDINQINFDQEIEKALEQGNYRLAVRLLFLSSLKQLNDAGLINWRADKTNSAYLNEITDTDQRQVFTAITRQFEYVWYGEFSIDGDSFQNIHGLFNRFKQMLP
ncbi:DUF4129 domain-containing protein [Mucilaginibacter agri]|uniref:DUF4129 domain-containing protein n=1 Tax=Mucilaginibacter agri TaxID=2695265 RepID=A0A965ZJJ6_9SPHI|nr:DUF4129 domain-containing protein [Mucilaginibacter agri]NCD72315.1 DUF4129 domain-containing protein [Mucilaginibacter agri]